MDISVDVMGTDSIRSLINALGKAAPETRKRWVNWIGIEAQGEMRKQLPSRFTMRGTADQFRKAIVWKIPKTAQADDSHKQFRGELVVGSSSGGTKATATGNLGRLLARHEDDDTRSSAESFRTSDGRTISAGFFIPANGIRTNTTGIPRAMYPRSIGATIRTGDGADVRGQGYYAKSVRGTVRGRKKSTLGESYVITEKGIFRYQHSISLSHVKPKPIWWFTRRIRTPARLRMWETAQQVLDTRAEALGMQAIEETLFRITL